MDPLVQLSVRLDPTAAVALFKAAAAAGQEPADFAAGLIVTGLMQTLLELDPSAAARLNAELELKKQVVEAAKQIVRSSFDPDVTLKVFREIRTSANLMGIYREAIGRHPENMRGNPYKARLNRSLGAIIKRAVGAEPDTVDGNPIKVQVSGELIFSYTRLHKPEQAIR